MRIRKLSWLWALTPAAFSLTCWSLPNWEWGVPPFARRASWRVKWSPWSMNWNTDRYVKWPVPKQPVMLAQPQQDIFEVQRAAIKPGQKVVIVDDLLATGGSLAAASSLVKKVGGVVLEGLVVIELVGLEGRKKLDCKVHSLIQYWEDTTLSRAFSKAILPQGNYIYIWTMQLSIIHEWACFMLCSLRSNKRENEFIFLNKHTLNVDGTSP